MLLHVLVVGPSSGKNILISMVTQLTTDIFALQLSSFLDINISLPDDGRTTETCSNIYISNTLTYDNDVA
jgi:hypothetical protein